MKSTPVRGVKENLKPVAHKQSEDEGEAEAEPLGETLRARSRGSLSDGVPIEE